MKNECLERKRKSSTWGLRNRPLRRGDPQRPRLITRWITSMHNRYLPQMTRATTLLLPSASLSQIPIRTRAMGSRLIPNGWGRGDIERRGNLDVPAHRSSTVPVRRNDVEHLRSLAWVRGSCSGGGHHHGLLLLESRLLLECCLLEGRE